MNGPAWLTCSTRLIDDEAIQGGWACIAVDQATLEELLDGATGEKAMCEALAAAYETADGLNVFRRHVTVTAYKRSDLQPHDPEEYHYDIEYEDAGPLRR